MRRLPKRKHIHHFERPDSAVHVVWRLKVGQPTLTPADRGVVLDVIRRGTDFGCVHFAAVIMDDHVHVLFRPGTLKSSVVFVTTWKSNSSRLICLDGGRVAPVWQRDFFQRWIRTPAHLSACATYIRNNPFRRWPGIESYPWVL